MDVLVTGAAGFVGGHAAAALARAGWNVRCLVRRAEDAERLSADGHAAVVGDLSDGAALARAAEGCAAVVHSAGVVAARSYTDMHATNVGGTARLAAALGALREPPRRFVLVSSLAARWPSPDARADGEAGDGGASAPVSRYGRTKLLGELAARRGLPAGTALTILRPPAVYGPRDRGILLLFRAAARGFRPRILGRRRRITLVYGPDLGDAIRRAVERPEAAGRTYAVADPRPVDLDEAFAAIARAVGGRTLPLAVPEAGVRAFAVAVEEVSRVLGLLPRFSRDKAAEFVASGWVCDPSAARRDLGWEPSMPLGEALAATAAWYRSNHWL